MVAQMTAYLAPPPDQLVATHLGNYRLLAREIIAGAREDDFARQEFLAQLLLKAHLASGSTTDLALSSDVATVIAATNSRLLSLTAQTGIEFLDDVVRVKKVVQSSVVDGIRQLVGGLLSRSEFIETLTGAGLAAQIDAAEIGNVAAIEAAVSDVTQSASDDTTFNFVVRLLRPSVTPVTVFYQTADGTAIAAGGDYTAASGSLQFAPGRNRADDRCECFRLGHYRQSRLPRCTHRCCQCLVRRFDWDRNHCGYRRQRLRAFAD